MLIEGDVMANKRKWGRPKLIVLERGRSGEAILNYCKTMAAAMGPGEKNSMCCWIPGEWACGVCDFLTTS